MNRMKNFNALIMFTGLLCGLYLWLTFTEQQILPKKPMPTRFILIKSTPSKFVSLSLPVEIMTLDNQEISETKTPTPDKWNPSFVKAYHAESVLIMGSVTKPGLFEGRYVWTDRTYQVKSFEVLLCESCLFAHVNFLEKNGELILFIKSATLHSGKLAVFIKGYSLSNAKPVELTYSDLKYSRSLGMPGGSSTSVDMLAAIFVKDNQATFGVNTRIPLGWTFPDNYKPELNEGIVQMLNNKFLRAITSQRLHFVKQQQPYIEFKVQNKMTDNWAIMKIDGQLPNLREFGPWVASERKMQVDTSRDTAPLIILHDDKYLTFDARAHFEGFTQTGQMSLINPIENRTIRIDTKQPDSEILLVENERVYYRVNDELYTADIGQDSLENTKLMVKDERILDVHWMMHDKSGAATTKY